MNKYELHVDTSELENRERKLMVIIEQLKAVLDELKADNAVTIRVKETE